MTQQRTLDLTGILGDEDLRGLALILDYASEQARKLDLAETTDLISRACRTLEGKLSALPLKTGLAGSRISRRSDDLRRCFLGAEATAFE